MPNRRRPLTHAHTCRHHGQPAAVVRRPRRGAAGGRRRAGRHVRARHRHRAVGGVGVQRVCAQAAHGHERAPAKLLPVLLRRVLQPARHARRLRVQAPEPDGLLRRPEPRHDDAHRQQRRAGASVGVFFGVQRIRNALFLGSTTPPHTHTRTHDSPQQHTQRAPSITHTCNRASCRPSFTSTPTRS